MGRSQRHKVYIQGVAADGKWRAEGVVGNVPVPGADGGPLQGSQVPGPVAVTVAGLQALLESGWTPGGGPPDGGGGETTATITGIDPTSTAVGQAVTMTVTGTGFTDASTVMMDGNVLVTDFVSDTQLTADVPGPLQAGTVAVTVDDSEPVTFSVI